jgi:hypothetical protein
MAANKLYKFRRIEDVLNFLNGGIVGGTLVKAQGGGTPANLGPGINGLVGKTLIFTAPASATVTFATVATGGGSADPTTSPPGTNPDPYTLLFKDIKKQIEAAVSGTLVIQNAEGQLVIIESSPSGGVTLVKTGTANALLGFDISKDTVGKVYKPAAVSNSAPCWTWSDLGNDNMFSVWTWE